MTYKKNDYVVSIRSLGASDWVDISGEGINYVDVGRHKGLQCNFVGDSNMDSEYQEIHRLCEIIVSATKELHKLNKVT